MSERRDIWIKQCPDISPLRHSRPSISVTRRRILEFSITLEFYQLSRSVNHFPKEIKLQEAPHFHAQNVENKVFWGSDSYVRITPPPSRGKHAITHWLTRCPNQIKCIALLNKIPSRKLGYSVDFLRCFPGTHRRFYSRRRRTFVQWSKSIPWVSKSICKWRIVRWPTSHSRSVLIFRGVVAHIMALFPCIFQRDGTKNDEMAAPSLESNILIWWSRWVALIAYQLISEPFPPPCFRPFRENFTIICSTGTFSPALVFDHLKTRAEEEVRISADIRIGEEADRLLQRITIFGVIPNSFPCRYWI